MLSNLTVANTGARVVDVARFNVVSVTFRTPEVGVERPAVATDEPPSGVPVLIVLLTAPLDGVLACKLPLKLVRKVFDVLILEVSTAPVFKLRVIAATAELAGMKKPNIKLPTMVDERSGKLGPAAVAL